MTGGFLVPDEFVDEVIFSLHTDVKVRLRKHVTALLKQGRTAEALAMSNITFRAADNMDVVRHAWGSGMGMPKAFKDWLAVGVSANDMAIQMLEFSRTYRKGNE